MSPNASRIQFPADAIAVQMGAGRLVAGSMVLAAPVASARLLGADTATARRVSWLTRMMGIRDAAIGAGAFLAARQDPSSAQGWVLAGAASDTVDALVLLGARRAGRVKGVIPAALVPVAAGAAVVAVAASLRLRRG